MLRGRETWLYSFLARLLSADEGALSLLDASARAAFAPAGGGAKLRAPKFAKVDMYHYTMAAPLWQLASRWARGETVAWWAREYEQSLVPAVLLNERGQLARAA